MGDKAFHNLHQVVFVDEGHLDVDLGEFRLSVRTQIFVSEALDDLIVAVESGYHE